MKSENYLEYESVSTFIRTNFKLGKWFMALGRIRTSKIEGIKDILIYKYSVRQLRTLKVGINSQYDAYKQGSAILGTITFCLTLLIGVFTTYIPYMLKPFDWAVNAQTLIDKDKIENLSITEKAEYLNEILISLSDEYSKIITNSVNVQMIVVTVFIVLATIISFIYISRFKWISTINSLINEAYEVKKEQSKVVS